MRRLVSPVALRGHFVLAVAGGVLGIALAACSFSPCRESFACRQICLGVVVDRRTQDRLEHGNGCRCWSCWVTGSRVRGLMPALQLSRSSGSAVARSLGEGRPGVWREEGARARVPEFTRRSRRWRWGLVLLVVSGLFVAQPRSGCNAAGTGVRGAESVLSLALPLPRCANTRARSAHPGSSIDALRRVRDIPGIHHGG
jgi:hypothetical protein